MGSRLGPLLPQSPQPLLLLLWQTLLEPVPHLPPPYSSMELELEPFLPPAYSPLLEMEPDQPPPWMDPPPWTLLLLNLADSSGRGFVSTVGLGLSLPEANLSAHSLTL